MKPAKTAFPNVKILKDVSGQALLISSFTLLILTAFVATTAQIAGFVNQKVKLQMAADAASYSGTIWQARMLNSIALMNDGIAASYAAMAAATGAMVSNPLKAPQMLKIVRRSWQTIKRLSDAQEMVVKSAPALILAEVNKIAKANGADIVFTWTDQNSPIPKLNLKRLKGKRSPLTRKGNSEQIAVAAIKKSRQSMSLVQRSFKRDFNKRLIAVSQAHVTPESSGILDMFKPNFDAELEPVTLFDQLMHISGENSVPSISKVILH